MMPSPAASPVGRLVPIVAMLGLSVAAPGTGQSPSDAPRMSPIQSEFFTLPGSLSNAWADFDNDGDLDLAVSSTTGLRLYRNTAAGFLSVGEGLGIPATSYEIRGLSWGDYDRDGWVDLIAGPIAADRTTMVFHNDRGKRFTEVAAALGLTIPGRSARVTNWVDYDNDGDLDVYATNRTGDNQLFRNDGSRFEPVFVGVGPTDSRPTVGACWFDFDRDGDLDAFLANQSGTTDALWRNDGDRFADVAPQLGLDVKGRATSQGGVGCAVGDYDNDGHLDLFLASYGRNALYRNRGDGTFTNVGPELGLAVENRGVGAAWGDYDNDGLLDLFVTSYQGTTPNQVPANALWHNRGAAGFVNVLTNESELNAGDHGVQWIDYDRDGALDLSITRGYGPIGGHPVFRNELPDSAARRSLSVLVLDRDGRSTRAGAEVRLYDPSGALLGTRPVPTGDGYGSQSAGPVHFGLGKLAAVTVEVTFMSRAGRQVHTIRGVDPKVYRGRSLVIRQP
ncbi:MAG: CRTAC1 family protein [Gemmatimonadales bacterium]